MLRSGAAWRDLPERYGPRTTCYNRFVRGEKLAWRDTFLSRRQVAALATRSYARAMKLGPTVLNRRIWRAAMAGLALATIGAADHQRPAKVALWRLDCGSIEIGNLADYSDSYDYAGQKREFSDGCYLIRNGDRYLLWDTGLPGELAGRTKEDNGDRLSLRTRIRDQLVAIGVSPDQVTFVAVSHYHFDHTGQAADFPGATLLVDRKEWDAIRARPDRAERFSPWIDGGGRVETLTYDHDVFGDGSTVILATPGHTPGHRSILVRLDRTGPVLLTGDAVHFEENWRKRRVPGFNTSRAESLASMERLALIEHRLKATLVIQHEQGDVSKLPPFPGPAT